VFYDDERVARLFDRELLPRPAMHPIGRQSTGVIVVAEQREGVMRLYMFEHCSLCFRVRMVAALKKLHLQEIAVLDDDSDTMIELVGKRVIPILLTDDRKPMLESMDMVQYVDSHGDPLLVGPERTDVAEWSDKAKTAPLTMPLYPLIGLPEFATVA
jgi:glutaredoxin 2